MRMIGLLQAGTLYLAIAAALIAGLAASYGRELEARRRPDRSWWISRLLIMPVLAIAAAAAAEMLKLSSSMAAFATAMLSLGGYDALGMIERKWLRRLESAAALGTEPKAKPGEP